MGNGGIQTEVSFGKMGKGKMCLQQYFSLGINRISEGEKGTVVKIGTEAGGLQESSRANTFQS